MVRVESEILVGVFGFAVNTCFAWHIFENDLLFVVYLKVMAYNNRAFSRTVVLLDARQNLVPRSVEYNRL